MLVLARNIRESVAIRHPVFRPITVCVLGIRSEKCTLGFDAPHDIQILRTELLDSADEPISPFAATDTLLRQAAALLEGHLQCNLSNRSPVEAETLRLAAAQLRAATFEAWS